MNVRCDAMRCDVVRLCARFGWVLARIGVGVKVVLGTVLQEQDPSFHGEMRRFVAK